MFLTSVIATFLACLSINAGSYSQIDSTAFAVVSGFRTAQELKSSGVKFYYHDENNGVSIDTMVFTLNLSGYNRAIYGYAGTSNVSYDFYLEWERNDETYSYQSPLINEYFSSDLIQVTIPTFIDDDNMWLRIRFYLLDETSYTYFDTESPYSTGYTDGYNTGLSEGTSTGYSNGYDTGYADAKEEYENQSATVTSIFQGILSIGLIPVEFFMSIFNFSVLGVNITSIVSAILTLMVLVILMRIILGGKGKE